MGRTTQIRLADGDRYELKFDFNAYADFEDMTGQSLREVRHSSPGLREMRALLAAGLRHQYPGITEREAGELLYDNVRKNKPIFAKIGEAVAKNQPDEDRDKADEDPDVGEPEDDEDPLED